LVIKVGSISLGIEIIFKMFSVGVTYGVLMSDNYQEETFFN